MYVMKTREDRLVLLLASMEIVARYFIVLKPSVKIDLMNGALECEYRKYEIFDGRYKEFKEEDKLGVSSTKSVTGHMLGAAGGVETIATALALRDGVMPPTIGYRVPDEDCDLDYVTEGARRADIRYALSNSLGFGGHNASLLFKKYEG